MANYFYFDANGDTQGPVSEEQLQELVAQGTITAQTPMSTDTGRRGTASQLAGLVFPQHYPSASESGILDIGFTRFISNTWISIIWVILIIAHFLVAVGAIFMAFNTDQTLGTISLLAVPLTALILLLSSRMALELAVIFFRIETNTRETKEYLCEIKELLGKK